MPSIKKNAIVMRAGVVTDRQIREGAQVDTRDVVSDLSVQVWNTSEDSFRSDEIINKLRAKLPQIYHSYALCRARNITDAGGTLRWQAVRGNEYHAVIDGLTVEKVVEIFKRNQY